MPSDPPSPYPLPPRRPDPVALAWIGGVALAGLAYAVGPEHVVSVAWNALAQAAATLNDIAGRLTATAFEVMRAVAIGLFGAFMLLSLLSIRRHNSGRVGLVVVAVVFLLLVWDAADNTPSANTRWLAALLLAGFSAIAATNRLAQPAGRVRGGWHLPGAPPRQ